MPSNTNEAFSLGLEVPLAGSVRAETWGSVIPKGVPPSTVPGGYHMLA